ncbi:hypothetical protein, partial [Bacteroides xylanisolvens]|uniref:hypothetical protein n=1 Tax=Bacteroides xylanisolvens TaxID=371601 RepID=UPI0022EB792B
NLIPQELQLSQSIAFDRLKPCFSMSKAPLYRTKTTYIIYASLENNAKYNPPQQTTAFKKLLHL